MSEVRWTAVPAGVDVAELDRRARESGLVDSSVAGLEIAVGLSDADDLTYDPTQRRLTDERFHLVTGATPGEPIRLTATGMRGIRWGLSEIARRLDGDQWKETDSVVGPAFAVRGIIEGFYGPPWSHPLRLSMVDFAARNRFNTFMYAPKDDVFLRDRWREFHRGDELDRLSDFVGRCHSMDIDAMVGVSPGLSMRYSDEADRSHLVEKVTALAEMGADRIALLFDDIPARLQHDADRERFDRLVDAHVEVSNLVFDALSTSGVPMVVCPTQYWGRGDEDYITRMGTGLDGRIDLFWTGRAICSPAITADEAAHFARSTHRPPLYWDNYPVNDVAMTAEMHIGPYERRDPGLAGFSAGVLANAMEYAEASKISLATVADYLWNPRGYEPGISWESALRQVGGSDAGEWAMFGDAVRASCLSDPDPVEVSAEWERFQFESDYGDPAAAGERFSAFLDRMETAAVALLGDGVDNLTLAREVRPWIEKYALGVKAFRLLAAGAPRSEISGIATEWRSRPQKVFGDLLDMALNDALT